eukprot:9080583-Pyramimonas_sp.AAC.1
MHVDAKVLLVQVRLGLPLQMPSEWRTSIAAYKFSTHSRVRGPLRGQSAHGNSCIRSTAALKSM